MNNRQEDSVRGFTLAFPSGSIRQIGTIQRMIAWPPRKDDTHKSRSVNNFNIALGQAAHQKTTNTRT